MLKFYLISSPHSCFWRNFTTSKPLQSHDSTANSPFVTTSNIDLPVPIVTSSRICSQHVYHSEVAGADRHISCGDKKSEHGGRGGASDGRQGTSGRHCTQGDQGDTVWRLVIHLGCANKTQTDSLPRSNQDIINQAQVEITDRRLFDLDRQENDRQRQICENGPLDKRMGISGKRENCETCNEPLLTCNGHFGHVKLILPIFHVGYFKKIIQILQCICKAWKNRWNSTEHH